MELKRILLREDITKTLGLYDEDLQRFFELAFKHGGFIAGGAARRIALRMDRRDDPRGREISDTVAQELQTYLGSAFNSGDIDLFFENGSSSFIEDLDRNAYSRGIGFNWTALKRDGALREATLTKTLIRIEVCDTKKSIEDMLESFDIFNSCVAFKDNFVVLPDGWFELEAQKLLHIYQWKSAISTIQRMARYFRRHQLFKLSPKTASELGDAVMAALTEVKSLGEQVQPSMPQVAGEENGKKLDITKDGIIYAMRTWMPQLTNDQLLLLTSVVPPTERFYNFETPFEILQTRALSAMKEQSHGILHAISNQGG